MISNHDTFRWVIWLGLTGKHLVERGLPGVDEGLLAFGV